MSDFAIIFCACSIKLGYVRVVRRRYPYPTL